METDVLVTHTPAKWHRDLPVGLGDEWLLREAWRVKPALHVFGHVHAGYGRQKVGWDEMQRVYEGLSARNPGGLRDMLDLWGWVEVVRMVLLGVSHVLWTRVWGGFSGRGGWMVNAALSYQSTGRLGNEPQVVEI